MSENHLATANNKEMNKIVLEKDSVNTHRATTVAWNIFQIYMHDKTYIRHRKNQILQLFSLA